MNKREGFRIAHLEENILQQQLGFTAGEARQLRRISNTLRRWYEHECNGNIQRNEDTGVVYWYNANAHYLDPNDPRAWSRIADRETGAIKRLDKIIARVNVARAGKVGALSYYLQTDPRGAALYILRPGDVPAGEDVSAYYSRGICVY